MNGDRSMKEGTEQMVERHISEAVNDRTLGELALFASSVEEKKEPCILIDLTKFHHKTSPDARQ